MRVRWWHWVEYPARAIVWLGVILFSFFTVLGAIPILPENSSIKLLIFFDIFIFAMVITWGFDLFRTFPPRRIKN